MDEMRRRRTRDGAWRAWYARHRQRRFARYLGFVGAVPAPYAVAGIVEHPFPPDPAFFHYVRNVRVHGRALLGELIGLVVSSSRIPT
jgi:hypothetical protein